MKSESYKFVKFITFYRDTGEEDGSDLALQYNTLSIPTIIAVIVCT